MGEANEFFSSLGDVWCMLDSGHDIPQRERDTDKNTFIIISVNNIMQHENQVSLCHTNEALIPLACRRSFSRFGE